MTAHPKPRSSTLDGQDARAAPQGYFDKIATSHDTLDKVQQGITNTLQQIDKHFSDCHEAALVFYQALAQYHAVQHALLEAMQVRTVSLCT